MIINQNVSGGTTPTGTTQITSNGVHDVSAYASADVQVPTTAPTSYRAFNINPDGVLVNSTSTPWVPLPAGTKDIGDYILYKAYLNTSSNVLSGNIDLSSLTTVSGNYAMGYCFYSCTGIITVDLSGLTTISGNYVFDNMFTGCTGITSVDLSNLTTITGSNALQNTFVNCTNLTSIDLSSLTTISGSYVFQATFQGCTNLTSVDLSGITTITGLNVFSNTFMGCSNLSTVYLSDAITKRNPGVMLKDCPLTTNPYENCEYITVNTSGLCQGMHFVSTNMYKFEMSNIQNTFMFANNPYLEEAKFPVLTRWNGSNNAANMFYGCTNANFTDVKFPMLSVFRNAVPFTATSFPSQLTVHFRKDQQTLIQRTTGYPFGAAACVFDLVGTITVGGVDYIRQDKESTSGCYAWQKKTSNITVDGNVYTLAQEEITRNSYGSASTLTGPMLYGWKNGSTVYFTDSLTPQVGDFIWTAWNVAQSTTLSITAVDNEFVYTVNTAEPEVGDTVYSDTQGTVLGTITAVA